MTHRAPLFAALVSLVSSSLALSACSSSPSNTVDGDMIGGVAFEVADAGAMVRTNRGLTTILLTDFDDSCAVADESSQPSSSVFGFVVADFTAGSSAPPSAPGTYPILKSSDPLPTDGAYAQCGFGVDDATCVATTTLTCDSGTVTLTRVDATGYAGTFDVVISGSHVTGSFDAPACAGVSETGFGTCK